VILDAMAAIRAAHGGDVTAYTAAYSRSPDERRFDERRWARLAASRYSNVKMVEVEAPRDRWLQTLGKIVWHMDGPSRSPQVFPLWMIMERARTEGVPVLLEGQGADEVFAGYSQYATLALIDRIREGPRRGRECGWGAVPGAARAGARAASAAQLFRELVLATVSPLRTRSSRRASLRMVLNEEFLREAGDGPAAGLRPPEGERMSGRLERRLHGDFCHDILPGALRFGDAVSMAHSIENRLPFLDYRLVEFGTRLRSSARVGAGWTKRIVRDYLRRAGQVEIADRRYREGFPTPAWAWMAAGDGAVAREILLDPAARIRAIVDRPRLERLIDEHARGRDAPAEALYSLLATEVWWQQV
jgi:asparagine synthase (glutamine-hydrolysing)